MFRAYLAFLPLLALVHAEVAYSNDQLDALDCTSSTAASAPTLPVGSGDTEGGDTEGGDEGALDALDCTSSTAASAPTLPVDPGSGDTEGGGTDPYNPEDGDEEAPGTDDELAALDCSETATPTAPAGETFPDEPPAEGPAPGAPGAPGYDLLSKSVIPPEEGGLEGPGHTLPEGEVSLPELHPPEGTEEESLPEGGHLPGAEELYDSEYPSIDSPILSAGSMAGFSIAALAAAAIIVM